MFFINGHKTISKIAGAATAFVYSASAHAAPMQNALPHQAEPASFFVTLGTQLEYGFIGAITCGLVAGLMGLGASGAVTGIAGPPTAERNSSGKFAAQGAMLFAAAGAGIGLLAGFMIGAVENNQPQAISPAHVQHSQNETATRPVFLKNENGRPVGVIRSEGLKA